MKLNDEQREIVASNHNLIYWYANLCNIDIDEWYGHLATELCFAVAKYKPDKGSLANYFKLRCDWMINKEYRKMRSSSRAGETIEYIDNVGMDGHGTYDHIAEVRELFDGQNGEILKLKYHGYSQREIADQIGISQSYVSKIIKRAKEAYYEIE